ncbi:unnamed protein product [Chrysoparadoxa australica]
MASQDIEEAFVSSPTRPITQAKVPPPSSPSVFSLQPITVLFQLNSSPPLQEYDPLKSAEEGGFKESGGLGDLEASLRLGFIRKVYGILTAQLFMTFVVSLCCTFIQPLKYFLFANPWLTWVQFALSIGLLIALMMNRQKHPVNIYLLAAWTLVLSVTVGTVVAAYTTVGQGVVVVQAAGITLSVFLGLTIFTFQTHLHSSPQQGGALFCSLWILIIWGIVTAIMGYRHSFLYSLFGSFIFSLYILYDTSLMLTKLGYDEYIMASINLYLDIINLFLHILRMMSSAHRR